MVGGHVNGSVASERLFRFEFPERKGALRNLLQAVWTRWNITLFHYRNHGSDYGRVLAGIDVPQTDMTDFLDHLNVLHFSYSDETNNPVYRIFLGH
jgi:threonine dehydratase